MAHSPEDLLHRARAYCTRRKLTIEKQLGAGADGLVLSTVGRSAIKIFCYDQLDRRELSVYQRPQEHGVERVDGFSVPRLLDYHDELLVIELETVNPPFVLDFAGAYLDERPPFSDEEWEEWESDRQELFGADWARVQSLLSSFRGIGIHLNDVKPGNITLR